MLENISSMKQQTLEATYEHVNRLLQEEAGKNIENITEFTGYNDNSTVYEKKIQAIIVDSLKIKQGVINGLLSDDPHIIQRVLKCDWFFEGAVSPEFYEKSIFPYVSYSTRCKIINKLGRNIKSEQHAELLFKFTKLNYGRKYAELFIPKCSLEFISDYIAECENLISYNIGVKVLINICKRSPSIVISHIEKIINKKNSNSYEWEKYRKALVYLARYHRSAFIPFLENNYEKLLFFQFGKKLTKSFTNELKSVVQKRSGKGVWGVINQTVFFKGLNFDEQVQIIDNIVRTVKDELTPKNWSLAMRTVKPLLKLVAPSERLKLLNASYLQLYNQDFMQHPEMWQLHILELLPLEDRKPFLDALRKMKAEKIMDLQLLKECEDSERDVQDVFTYLLSCKDAFPSLSQLMTKMNTTVRREILLREMIKNTVINVDAAGMETVLNYILRRHKNDDPRSILKVMDYIPLKNTKVLNAKTWDLIEQMATMVLLNAKSHSLYKSIMEKYMRFRLSNNMDIREQVRNVVKLCYFSCPYEMNFVDQVEKPYSRNIITHFYYEIANVLSGEIEEDIKRKLLVSLLQTINSFNSRAKRSIILVKEFNVLVEEIDKMMKISKYNYEGSYLLHEVKNNQFLRGRYSESLLRTSLMPNTLQEFLKFNPNYVHINLESILNDIFTSYSPFVIKTLVISRSRLDFLNLTQKIEEISRENFKTSGSATKKFIALKLYSYFATIDDFTELVREYIPDKEKMIFDKDNGEFLEVQMKVPQVIKNIKPDSKNLSLIFKYLNGDYIRWTLSSFNSACHNTPSSVILPILIEYFPNRSISVKKVILHRIADISLNGDKQRYFQAMWDSEKHSSVRCVVFKTISKCFRENPNDEIFDVIKKYITESDELTIHDRPSLAIMPPQYLNEYVDLLWKFTERYENSRFVNDLRNNIIQHFNRNNIAILSEEFCENLIGKYLFDSSSKIAVDDFACSYLMSDPGVMKRKLSFIMKLMNDRKSNYKSVSSFLSNLRELSMKEPKQFVGVFEGVLEEWPNIYEHIKMFDELLQLKFAKIYVNVMEKLNFQTGSSSVELELGKALNAAMKEIPKYDQCISIISESVEMFLNALNVDQPGVIDGFLGDSFDQKEALFAVALLSPDMVSKLIRKEAGENVKVNEKFLIVVNKLKAVDDDMVKLHLNYRFKNEIN